MGARAPARRGKRTAIRDLDYNRLGNSGKEWRGSSIRVKQGKIEAFSACCSESCAASIGHLRKSSGWIVRAVASASTRRDVALGQVIVGERSSPFWRIVYPLSQS